MYYVDGIEPESEDAYGAYAVRIGFDESDFNRKMKDAKYLKLANEEFQRARDLGARSFPTVIMEKNGQRDILFSGYKDFGSVERFINE